MAYSAGQDAVSVIAGATFSTGDLHKFIALNSSGHAVIGPTTAAGNIFGTLLEPTYTTAAAGSEAVSVGLLQGIGALKMVASTAAAGNTVAASSNGFGTAPTTDAAALGVIVSGSSGAAGRVVSVAWIAASAADV